MNKLNISAHDQKLTDRSNLIIGRKTHCYYLVRSDMDNSHKNRIFSSIVVFIIFSFASQHVAQASQQGGSCTKAGATATAKVSGKTVSLLCKKIATKLKWVQVNEPVSTTLTGSTTVLIAGSTTVPVSAPTSKCAINKICAVGDIGPGGGVVFYVSDITIDLVSGISAGGKYLEAAPSDTSSLSAWCNDTTNLITLTGSAFSSAIGSGALNTLIMTTGSANGATPACTSGAGFDAANYSNAGLSDWFLPSKDELNLMYTNLKNNNPSLGSFSEIAYWSSSEVGATCKVGRMCSNFVWAQVFATGGQGETGKGTRSLQRTSGNNARAIRAFG